MSFSPIDVPPGLIGGVLPARDTLCPPQLSEAGFRNCSKPSGSSLCEQAAEKSHLSRLTSTETDVGSHAGDPSLWSASSAAGEPQCLSPSASGRGAVRSVHSALSSFCDETVAPFGESSTDQCAQRVLTDEHLQVLAAHKHSSACNVLSGLMRFQPVPTCVINGVDLNMRAKSLAPLGKVRLPGGKLGGAKRCRDAEDTFEVRCVSPRREHHLSQLPHGHAERLPAPQPCSNEDLTTFAIRAAEEEVLAAVVTTQLDDHTQVVATKALSSMSLAPVPDAVAAARQAHHAHALSQADAQLDTPASSPLNFHSLEDVQGVASTASCDAGYDLGILFQDAEAASSPFAVDVALY